MSDIDEIKARLEKLEAKVFAPPPTEMQKVYAIAKKEIGVAETPGPKSTPRVLEYLRACGINEGDDTPWCSAFVNWCCLVSGIKGTNSAAARSWLDWGQDANGQQGDIVVYWRGSREGWQGHVGIVDHVDVDGSVHTLGGNQGDMVSIVKYPKDRVLAFRKFKQPAIKDD